MKPFDDDNLINPATGLPMVGGIGGIDVGGDPFGSSFHHDSLFESGIDSGSSISDTFSSNFDSGSSFSDDSCGSFGSGCDDW